MSTKKAKGFSQKRLFYLVGIALIFGGIGGYVGGRISMQRNQIPTPPPIVIKPTTMSNGWDTYSDTYFTINYPDILQYNFYDNSIAPSLLRTTIFSNKNISPEDTSASHIMIRVFDKNSMTIDAAAHSYFGNIGTSWKNVTIGNYTGQVTDAFDPNSGKQVGLVALLSIGNVIYYFDISQPSAKEYINQQDFYKMLATFKLALP